MVVSGTTYEHWCGLVTCWGLRWSTIHGHFLSLRSLNNVPLSIHFVIMLQTKRKANSNMASTMKKRHISIQYTRALTSVFGFGYLDDASLRVLTVKIKWSNSSVEFSYWWSDWTMRQVTICQEIVSHLLKFFLIFVWTLSQQKQQRYLALVQCLVWTKTRQV